MGGDLGTRILSCSPGNFNVQQSLRTVVETFKADGEDSGKVTLGRTLIKLRGQVLLSGC